ncbi:MAG: hypothetical protein ACI808_002432 [Paraglaciecola sp.]|jgi:hypothetical protein
MGVVLAVSITTLVYTHATSQWAFQSLWCASIQGTTMPECRLPFKWMQHRSGVSQRLRPGGF